MSNSLIKLGMHPRKTATIKYPKISDYLDSHFIRGYFDGDGSITTGPTIKMASSITILSTIQKKLIEYCNIGKTKLHIRHKDRQTNSRSLEIGGRRQVRRVFDFLYEDADLFLKRKRNKFLELLNEN